MFDHFRPQIGWLGQRVRRKLVNHPILANFASLFAETPFMKPTEKHILHQRTYYQNHHQTKSQIWRIYPCKSIDRLEWKFWMKRKVCKTLGRFALMTYYNLWQWHTVVLSARVFHIVLPKFWRLVGFLGFTIRMAGSIAFQRCIEKESEVGRPMQFLTIGRVKRAVPLTCLF